jgi:hypothetical protein
LVVSIVVISGLVLLGILLKKKSSPGLGSLDNIDKKEGLGQFEILARYRSDYYGRKIEIKDLTARPTLLLFLNTNRDDDLILFHKVFAEWHARGLNLVLVASDPGSIFTQPAVSADGVWYFSDDSREISACFRVSYENSSFILFDRRGDQLSAGDNTIGYELGLRIDLRRSLGMRPPLREVFAPVGHFIKDIDWLKDMRSVSSNPESQGSILVFLNAFCETCNSWVILERLKEFVMPGRAVIKPVLVLSADFSLQDRQNFEARYSPGFPVLIAGGALADKLRFLREEYFHAELNNIMVLLSKEGEIISSADAGCGCYQDILKRAEEITAMGMGK